MLFQRNSIEVFYYTMNSPSLSLPLAIGILQAAFGKAVPVPLCRTNQTLQYSPSSQWEAVAGVAYHPRCHCARSCQDRVKGLRRSLQAISTAFLCVAPYVAITRGLCPQYGLFSYQGTDHYSERKIITALGLQNLKACHNTTDEFHFKTKAHIFVNQIILIPVLIFRQSR